jgi:hypothetical protein
MLRWSWLLAVVVITLIGSGPHVAAQSAGNGLEERSVNSFEFDPDRGVVRVTIDITLQNVTTDRIDGDQVNRTFFDGYFAAVPLGAENIVATRNGRVLTGELISNPEFPAFSTYRFPLDTQLFSGQSANVQVSYDHLGAPPRDSVPWRINEAYAGFVALGIGDEGLVTLRISQPAGYEFDEFTDLTGFDVGAPDEFGTVVYTRAGLNEDALITVGMANDDRLISRPLDVDGVDLELRSWPDDPEWTDFAVGRVEAGIPALEELIGANWPVDGSFTVRETVEPNLRGYAGWFDAQSREIAVGEALDADTIYHELSHAWFNGSMSTERWLAEGLAQVYAAELVRRDGDEARTPLEPNADDPAAVPLTNWGDVGGERSAEEYGYATSFWVLDALVDEVGFDGTDDVVAALRDGLSPYDDADRGQRPDDDWKRIYDMFVEVGRSVAAGDLFLAHVVNPEDTQLIGARDRAAADVVELTERSAPWGLPVGVRHTLELWELAEVVDAIAGADNVLDQRTALEAIETSVGVDEPDRAGTAYAGASRRSDGSVDYTESTEILGTSIDVGQRLIDRVSEIDDLEAAARAAPPELADIERVDDFATALAVTDEQIVALERIVEVDRQLDAASGIFTWIGRWGSGVEADLHEARSHVQQGDNDAAVATLATTDDQIGELAASGALRLGIIVGSALVLVGVFVLVRRRRTHAAAAEGVVETSELRPT